MPRTIDLDEALELAHINSTRALLPASSSTTTTSSTASPSDAAMAKVAPADAPAPSSPEDGSHGAAASKLTVWRIFLIFLGFGLRAFGGPIAQIQMMKEQLVLKENWVSITRFHRVLAVYQVLPGPEAHELACYFGYLRGGRPGSVAAGLGFMLPGFVLLMIISAIYTKYHIADYSAVTASLRGMQIAVSAMIFLACAKLGDNAFRDPEKKTFSWRLGWYGFMGFVLTTMEVHFLITLAFCGIAHVLLCRKTRRWAWRAVLAILMVGGLVGYGFYVNRHGKPGPIAFSSAGLSRNGRHWGLFVLGLLGGLLTFGGAYTVIPFIYNDAVVASEELTSEEFLDTIAFTNVLPTPLVLFVTMVGYISAQGGGAVLMVLGMMLPAFSFTLIGHEIFEKALDSPTIHPFLDGVSAGIVGLVLVTAFDFAKKTIQDPIDAVLFALVVLVLQQAKHKYTPIVVIFCAAAAGHILYFQP